MPAVAVIALIAVIVLWGIAAMTPAGTMRTSPTGRAAIIQHEGVRYEPYQDVAGFWTIGIGHKIVPGDGVRRDPTGAYLPIDETGVMNLFETDLANAENAIRKHVKVPLTQGQFDALADFVFNLGPAALASSTLLKFLNSGNYPSAAAEFKRWVYATNPATGQKEQVAGLVARRDANYRTFIA